MPSPLVMAGKKKYFNFLRFSRAMLLCRHHCFRCGVTFLSKNAVQVHAGTLPVSPETNQAHALKGRHACVEYLLFSKNVLSETYVCFCMIRRLAQFLFSYAFIPRRELSVLKRRNATVATAAASTNSNSAPSPAVLTPHAIVCTRLMFF